MSNPYDDNIIDSRGRMLCKPHRREVCHICCCDHRMCNEIVAADTDESDTINEIVENNGRVQEVEHRAMAQQHAAEGGRGPLILNSETGQRIFDTVATRPNQEQCAHCGMTSDKLQTCSRCKDTKYCSKECQKAHFPTHKGPCKAAAQAREIEQQPADLLNDSTTSVPKGKRISWRDLEALGGDIARDKILELRILSQPVPFLRHTCEGKDYKNDVRTLTFHCDRVPPGLALGKIMRWRNPHFHMFMDGRTGARIEDEDVANISIH